MHILFYRIDPKSLGENSADPGRSESSLFAIPFASFFTNYSMVLPLCLNIWKISEVLLCQKI